MRSRTAPCSARNSGARPVSETNRPNSRTKSLRTSELESINEHDRGASPSPHHSLAAAGVYRRLPSSHGLGCLDPSGNLACGLRAYGHQAFRPWLIGDYLPGPVGDVAPTASLLVREGPRRFNGCGADAALGVVAKVHHPDSCAGC